MSARDPTRATTISRRRLPMARPLAFLLPLLFLTSAACAQSYVNGPMITHPGSFACSPPTPPGHGSALQSPLTTHGFGASTAFRCADDFTVPPGQNWTLNTLKVYAFHDNFTTSTTSTLTGADYRIWCGTPGSGGTVIADFIGSNQLVSSTWTSIYRGLVSNITNCSLTTTQKKIMDVVMSGNGVVLGPGTYWLDYGLSAPTQPFTPPITILGTIVTGNARQGNLATGVWTPLTSGGASNFQGIPFEIQYTASPSAGALFERNSATASCSWNGVQVEACGIAAAVTRACLGTTISFSTSSTLLGSPWELAYSALPAVSAIAGGFNTASGQAVNINLSAPQTGFLNDLTLPVYNGFNLGPFSAAFVGTLTAQMVIFDPSAPDMLHLSQAAQLTIATPTSLSFPLSGPALNESSVTIALNSFPTCSGLGLPYFGTLRTVMHVTSNGYVSFDSSPVVDFSPTIAEAQSRAIIGVWEDLNPAQVGSGNITITNPTAGQVRVNYNGVWRSTSGSPTNAVSFSMTFDQSGPITMSGLNGILPTPGASTQFLGLSPGGAANPGLSSPLPPGALSCPAGTMLYRFTNLAPISTPGVTTISLSPNGSNGYTGTAF